MNTISNDSKAILLLCSNLGLVPNKEFSPLTPTEWYLIAKKLHHAQLTPSNLLEYSKKDLAEFLSKLIEEGWKEKVNYPKAFKAGAELEANRCYWLLQRGVALSIELDRLANSGIHPITRADSKYPRRLKDRLGASAPPVLFFAGDLELAIQKGVAVVGSRHASNTAQKAAEKVGECCGLSGLILYSGGARGVDQISMKAALANRGYSVGVLADSLKKATMEWREHLHSKNLCLLTPYHPETGFSIGNAMGRNKLIYCLADYAIVVATDKEKGGTWAGATEALKKSWVPVFILSHKDMPEGNKALIQNGGIPLPYEELSLTQCREIENSLKKLHQKSATLSQHNNESRQSGDQKPQQLSLIEGQNQTPSPHESVSQAQNTQMPSDSVKPKRGKKTSEAQSHKN